jgi:hypothetical protein
MTSFSQELKAARASLGHKSARSFFDWLKEGGVSFNYSYYMRLEQGGLPSEKVAQELASVLKGEWNDRLILAYCRTLFPKNSYLFARASAAQPAVAVESYEPTGQKELTPKQVAVLASSEANYHLFLISTLARRPVQEGDLQKWFPAKTIQASLRQLEGAQIIRRVENGFEGATIEARFPEAYNKELKEAFQKFDHWDESFGGQFDLDFLMNKMLIRRVSGRYLLIIRRQMDLLLELLRSSDEVDTRYNDNVLQLKVVLRQGKLPG